MTRLALLLLLCATVTDSVAITDAANRPTGTYATITTRRCTGDVRPWHR